MAKLLIGIEKSAASSTSIVLRWELPVNLTHRTRRLTYHYRVSGLVQWPLGKSLHSDPRRTAGLSKGGHSAVELSRREKAGLNWIELLGTRAKNLLEYQRTVVQLVLGCINQGDVPLSS